MLKKFINAQIPDFAQTDHPFMRYNLLRQPAKRPVSSLLLRLVLFGVMSAVAVFVGWQIATRGGTTPLEETSSALDQIFVVLYFPLIGLMTVIRIMALSANINTISTEAARGTWDTLKITTGGAKLLMKTRWAAVFYQLGWWLAIVVVARLFFIGVALVNLTQFQGRHLDLLMSGTTPFGTPTMSETGTVVVGITITAMMFTAALLAPFTAVAFDAALGMFVGTLARGRFWGILGQVSLILLRVALTLSLIWVGVQALSLGGLFAQNPTGNPLTVFIDNQAVGWFSAFASVVEGDLGLNMIQVDRIQHLWADFDYGMLIGVAALGYVLLQAAIANGLVLWAAARATRADNS